MKMISTYISLLLLGGFMLLFYYCSTHTAKSRGIGPAAKNTQVVLKRPAQPASMAMHLRKNQPNDKMGFSFFKDVVTNILPVLKNID